MNFGKSTGSKEPDIAILTYVGGLGNVYIHGTGFQMPIGSHREFNEAMATRLLTDFPKSFVIGEQHVDIPDPVVPESEDMTFMPPEAPVRPQPLTVVSRQQNDFDDDDLPDEPLEIIQ